MRVVTYTRNNTKKIPPLREKFRLHNLLRHRVYYMVRKVIADSHIVFEIEI